MHSSAHAVSVVDWLESRMLLSTAPYDIQTMDGVGGAHLYINGTDGNDTIVVDATSTGLKVSDQDGNETAVDGTFAAIEVHGDAGNDHIEIGPEITMPTWLYGDAGIDTILGGSGADSIFAGKDGGDLGGNGGSDNVVAMNSAVLYTITGGEGVDQFWVSRKDQSVADASEQEISKGNIHCITSFCRQTAKAVATRQNGGRVEAVLRDPMVTRLVYTYQSFSGRPLFGAAGPLEEDISQGAVGDCYFLAVLTSVARTDPATIRGTITELGDGTYAVRFRRSNRDVYVRVDADLPTSGDALAYAKLGSDDCLWVALMEKAYTYFRYGRGTYASISGGWMSQAFSALGLRPATAGGITGGASLLARIQTLLAQGRAVTFAVKGPHGAPLVRYHAYSVESVVIDATGKPVGLVLRNPWGIDGAGHDENPADGCVTLTAAQAFRALWVVQSA